MTGNIIKKLISYLILVLFALTGCKHTIKNEMDVYLQNQEAYDKKDIIFTTDLQDLLDRYELYQDKTVELTAPITYFGRENFHTWYLTLEKDGKQIRAYEDNYQHSIDRYTRQLLDWAKSKGGEVTVRGGLQEDGIELSNLRYNNYVVDTNVRRNSYEHYYRYPHNYRDLNGRRPPHRYGYRYHR